MTELNKEFLEQAKQENSPELSEEELMEAGGGMVFIKSGLGTDRKNGIIRVDEDVQGSTGMDKKSGVIRPGYMSGGKSKLQTPGKGEYC